MDRYQWRDRYAMVDGQMALVAAGDSGSAGNRIESARALAGHVRAAFHVGAWTFTPGVRHERMTLSRQDFGDDLARLGDGTQRSNDISVWLPGLGAHVDLVPNLWTAFAGVHRGFVPPGSAPDTEPEYSNHLEVGTRLSSRMVSGQITLFHSEHQNLLGADLTASGGTGSGDLFNGGSSRAQGIEVEAVGDVLELTGASVFFANGMHHFPVRVSYTYTQAVFTQAFESEFDPWGVVEEGDALPYLAPHQFSVSASWEAPRWSYDLNLRSMSAMRTSASKGELNPAQSTDAMAVLDMGIRHQAHGHLEWLQHHQRLQRHLRRCPTALWFASRHAAPSRRRHCHLLITRLSCARSSRSRPIPEMSDLRPRCFPGRDESGRGWPREWGRRARIWPRCSRAPQG